MILKYDHFEALLVIHKGITKEYCMTCADVRPGTYAEEMFSRMFDAIFSELADVEHEFETYYKVEYSDLTDYLIKRYNIDTEDVEEICNLKAQNPAYRIMHKREFTYGDYGIEMFAFSDSMSERITDILLQKI